ncbi:MAG: OFA family MFS transporter [Methanomassiliicoccales archaeon]
MEAEEGSRIEGYKLFGMDADKGRWLLVLIGLIINLCLGAIYSWSVFRAPLEVDFAVGATESLLPFIIFLAAFAFTMPLAGRPLDKYGPRKLAMIGGVLVGVGWILGSQASTMEMLAISYGVVGGIGVGIVYNCPICVVGRWFPDRRGLAVGITVLGFGLSPLVTAPIANSLIDASGPLMTLGIMGVAFLAIIIPLGFPLRFPPAEYAPTCRNLSAKATNEGVDRKEMLGKKGFWGIWGCYVIGTLAGLMAIGISSSVGQEIFELNAATAALLVGVFAIFNGIGRPIFGSMVDRFSPRNTAMISFGLITLAALMLAVGSGPGAMAVYVVGFCILWLCLGGWLAIAPASTATFFGTKHYGPNYGTVFTAYGVGAIAGSLLAGNLRDIMGSYTAVFLPVAILGLIGIVIAFMLMRPPKSEESS